MPFNISTFKSNGLIYDGARPSLFNVTLSVPQGIGIDNTSVNKFRFVCRTAELPASSLASFDVPYFGRKIKVAGDRTFADWQVTIMNDEDFSVRALFEAWSNAMNRMVANVRDPSLTSEQYKADLEVVQYGKTGPAIRSYNIIGAFPTEIGAISLDWDSTNSVETFPVTFSYDYWLPNIETSQQNAGGINAYGSLATTDGPLGPA